jgi:uncharacterized protein (DUF2141 family)
MKKAISLIVGLLFIPEIMLAANLTCLIKGLEHLEGSLNIAFYSSADTFLKDGKQIASCRNSQPLNKDSRLICPLPAGAYAAAVYHDENSNGKMDTNFLGIPKEGYGFSNNAHGSFGPPKYEDAAFTMGESDQETSILLKY